MRATCTLLMLLMGCPDTPGVQGSEATPTPVEESTPVDSDLGVDSDDSAEEPTSRVQAAELELSLGNPSFEVATADGAPEMWDGPGTVLIPDVTSRVGPRHQVAVLELRVEALNDDFEVDARTLSSVIGQARAGYVYEVTAHWVAPDERVLPAYIDIVFGDDQRHPFGQSAGSSWGPIRVERVALPAHEGQDVRVVIGAIGALGPANREFVVWFDDVNVSATLMEP